VQLVGLTNENEFYSDHYLSEIFSGDIRDVLNAWQEREASERERAKSKGQGSRKYEGYRSPPSALNALAHGLLQRIDETGRTRASDERIMSARSLARDLLALFEIPSRPHAKAVEDESLVPLLAEVTDQAGKPLLWVLEALPALGDEPDIDPLACAIQPEQLESLTEGATSDPKTAEPQTWQQVLSRQVFTLAQPPRWVILAGPRQWLLLDRAKFSHNRLLRFDWVELFQRRELDTFKAVSALLHKDSLLDAQGQCLLDTLDENAHKHAYGVSEDLKYALRECIELLGNEAASQLEARARSHSKSIYTSGDYALDAAELSLECLRYMYRLLFLFYIEARPDLGYAPVASSTYLKSYSLEHLRELELVPLMREAERNGRYINDSMQMLFRLVSEGYVPSEGDQQDILAQAGAQTGRDAFSIHALKSHLFDPQRTRNLNRVVFPNHLLQRVIQLMSLSRPGKGRKRRGRISYAQLGINQLGAVYEALLSYRGFFAISDLYEVKPKDETWNPLGTGYFVSAEALAEYDEEEKVFIKDDAGQKQLLKYSRGSFIYRLAGRDRQKSASYYTPEVLTRSLVKYALKEVWKEQLESLPDDAARARRVLELTVCEPAMGSAAFLNEAINQMADKYLELAQSTADEHIPQAEYAREKQKVKMYLADNNVYGVDLNPVAVELAEVSLWLNALSADRFVPWFGLQLHHGNSLIGARREVFTLGQLSHTKEGSWLKSAPERLPLGQSRAENQIWHFLLPDSGMALYNDKDVKKLYPDEIKAINAWRKQFTKALDRNELDRLKRLSERVSDLWDELAASLSRLRTRTTDPYAIYGREATCTHTSLGYKDAVMDQELLANQLENASAFRRLKLAMDYWCALWFWPIQEADQLPERDEWLLDLENLLLGDTVATVREGQQANLFAETNPEEGKRFVNKYGVVNFQTLFAAFPRLKKADEIAHKRRFFHWELAFADIFAERGGFDLILGNPPWIKVEWNSGDVLGDYEPRFVIRNQTAPQLARLREETFERIPALKKGWTDEFEGSEGTQNFLNGQVNYPDLRGVQTNLYKCFLPRAWSNGSEKGVAGFLHPEGAYDDPKGGSFRSEMYPRLRGHFQFINETKLFAEVHNQTLFSINVYGPRSLPSFKHIANLFIPNTLDTSMSHDGRGEVPGIKEELEGTDGRTRVKWNFDGHKDRIIEIGQNELALFASLYDEVGTEPLEARLPALHARQLIRVLEKFAAQPRRLGDLKGEYLSLEMWHETNAQNDGTIRRDTRFPDSSEEWVLSGPHFFVGNPFYNTPRAICNTNKAYDSLDLKNLPDDYLPRTNYVPACSPDEYRARTPKVPWVEEGKQDSRRVTEFYRLAFRGMIGSSSERTLSGSIIPKNAAHIHGVQTTAFRSEKALLSALGIASSIVADFFIKSTGRANLHGTWLSMPSLELSDGILVRILSLSCLTNHYTTLWNANWSDNFGRQEWASNLPNGTEITSGGKDLSNEGRSKVVNRDVSSEVLPKDFFRNLRPEWQRDCALRSDYSRRQALLEIDVIVSQIIGITLDELLTIYRVQFPVMRQYEADTWYDRYGRIVFTPSKGLVGVGLPRKARKADLNAGIHYSISSPERNEEGIALGWEDILHLSEGVVSKTFMDDTLPGGPTERTVEYHAPFFKPDREMDYRIAWEIFEKQTK
jgi:hypothetical protein